MPKLPQLNVDMDDDLLTRFRGYVKMNRTTMKAVVGDFVERYVRAAEQGAKLNILQYPVEVRPASGRLEPRKNVDDLRLDDATRQVGLENHAQKGTKKDLPRGSQRAG